MDNKQFTTEAAVLWSTIPPEARDRILAAVFCVKCRGSVRMINFRGKEDRGDLRLDGVCAKCGAAVVRIIETSERDKSAN